MADHHGSAFPAEEVSQLNSHRPMADKQHKKRELLASLPNDPATKSAQSVADRSTLRLK